MVLIVEKWHGKSTGREGLPADALHFARCYRQGTAALKNLAAALAAEASTA